MLINPYCTGKRMKMAQITPTVKLQPKRALLLRVSPHCCFYPAGPTPSASLCASPQGSCPFPPFFPAQSRAVQQPRAPQRSVGPCRSPGSSLRLCPGCPFGVRADEPGAGGSKTRRPPRSPLTILPPTSRAGARRLPASFPASLPPFPASFPPPPPGGRLPARPRPARGEAAGPGRCVRGSARALPSPSPAAPHTGGWLGQTTTALCPMHAPGWLGAC